ncbi:spore germination protein [Desulfitobacterium sp.]|uniref:spore germination protein n=1 Tax=Desulfitobacterium sp. TaxID=49981 RepID=UPI002C99EA1C|nr:spore germination protein [Desulfitobacterium sp.]HVJ50016.1 spore germination protein [Desulfitobacterium sp.]
MKKLITKLLKPLQSTKQKDASVISRQQLEAQAKQLTPSLTDNLALLKDYFQSSVDIVYRQFNIGFELQNRALLVYIQGLNDTASIKSDILKPLMYDLAPRLPDDPKQGNLLAMIKDSALPNCNVQETQSTEDVIQGILTGQTALLLESFSSALLIDTKGGEYRAIDEPDTEAVVRGPREGFTENISVNAALLRRKIKDTNLKIEGLSLGTRTKTQIYIAYVQGIANNKLATEVKLRLQRIDIDGILESGYIEQLIEDAPGSIFPTVGNTEKPDVLAAKLLEGRVGIFVDGTPFVLVVPHLLVEAFQSSEDYYSRHYYSTVVRWIRIVAFFIAILLPATYIALESFQPEMIPTDLLFSMAGAREGIPFPAYMEVFIMGVIFEIMREAGVRMPRPIGQAVSIVGALVLGEAAVRAGIVSDPLVIVVSMTAISGFVISSLGDVTPILRLLFMGCAASLGIFGILMGILLILIHLVKLRSFGVPYLAPLAPGNRQSLKDVLIKAPLWAIKTRPRVLGAADTVRQSSGKPSPEK